MDLQQLRARLSSAVAQLRQLSTILRAPVHDTAQLGRGLVDPQVRLVEEALQMVDDEMAVPRSPAFASRSDSPETTLRAALVEVRRGLDVAKLGLSRDGVQHRKIVSLERIVERALSAPSGSSPAPAEGGDAVREAPGRWSFDDGAIGWLPGGRSSLSTRIIARPPGLINHQWYNHARDVCTALSTPTEGPVSVVPAKVATYDVLDEAKINALPLPLIARFAGDKDWLPIHDIGIDAPLCRIDVSGKIEPRRFSEIMELKDGDGVIHNPDDFYLDSDAPTEGPASQTEGMGGDVNEAAEREAFEKWWPKHWPNAGSVSDNVWQGWMGRAALTPPETAEAVPVAPFGALRAIANELSWSHKTRAISERIRAAIETDRASAPVQLDPEAARLREDLERVTRERNVARRREKEMAAEKDEAFAKHDDAVKALETARKAISRTITNDRRFDSFNHQMNGRPLTVKGETEFMTVKESRRIVDGIWSELNAVLISMPAARSVYSQGGE